LLGLTQCGSPLVNLRQLQLQKLAYIPMHLGQAEFVLRRWHASCEQCRYENIDVLQKNNRA
jgi:hypothetical protein